MTETASDRPATQPSDLIGFLRGLKAIREYTDEPVNDAALNDILYVGLWSASAKNTQPTELVVIRDIAMKTRIAELGIRPAAGAALVIVVITPGDESRAAFESFDEGRMVERLLLAARAHGLGGNINTIRGESPSLLKDDLGIPQERRLWAVVTIGHVDHAAHNAHIARIRAAGPNATPSGDLPLWEAAGRKSVDTFIHWDRY